MHPDVPLPGEDVVPPSARSALTRGGGTVSPGTPTGALAGVRTLVSESWQRSLSFGVDPDAAPHTDIIDSDLRDFRDAHPLAAVLPVIHQLLTRHTVGAGLIVAIGDHRGRLLWVDGDRDLVRLAEAMAFMGGADWSEQAVGTSAPGTALALGRSVQIRGEEHFNRMVHPWSCSSVPVRNRETGDLLGVIDLTGREAAVGPGTLPLLEATVAAVEAELDVVRLSRERPRLLVHHDSSPAPRPHAQPRPTGSPRPVVRLGSRGRGVTQQAPTTPRNTHLAILGREVGRIHADAQWHDLSVRHTEILTLLAWHPRGLTAPKLAFALYGRDDAVVTLRAEMVRLRGVLTRVAPRLVPLSRPYRLPEALELDVHRVLAFLDHGAHRVALGAYVGPVLPGSRAPGIETIRARVRAQLREALLSSANVETLLVYARMPEGHYDVEVWRQVLGLLAPRSPRRAAVVAHLEQVEAELQ